MSAETECVVECILEFLADGAVGAEVPVRDVGVSFNHVDGGRNNSVAHGENGRDALYSGRCSQQMPCH